MTRMLLEQVREHVAKMENVEIGKEDAEKDAEKDTIKKELMDWFTELLNLCKQDLKDCRSLLHLCEDYLLSSSNVNSISKAAIELGFIVYPSPNHNEICLLKIPWSTPQNSETEVQKAFSKFHKELNEAIIKEESILKEKCEKVMVSLQNGNFNYYKENDTYIVKPSVSIYWNIRFQEDYIKNFFIKLGFKPRFKDSFLEIGI